MGTDNRVLGFYRYNDIDHRSDYKDIMNHLKARGNRHVRFITEVN